MCYPKRVGNLQGWKPGLTLKRKFQMPASVSLFGNIVVNALFMGFGMVAPHVVLDL